MAYYGYALGLKDKKGETKAHDKDIGRMMDIVDKSAGDTQKMLDLCRLMANKISKYDKAQRRANAAMKVLPRSIAKQASLIFLSEFK